MCPIHGEDACDNLPAALRMAMYPNEDLFSKLRWYKTVHSLTNGECVEVAGAGGWVAVRDSKNPDGAVLACPVSAWRTFVAETKKAHSNSLRQESPALRGD